MCEVQPDYLPVLHTFLKSRSGFITVLKGGFVETHELRCLTTELAKGPKVISRGPKAHLLAQGPHNRNRPAKKAESFTPLDVCTITCYQGRKPLISRKQMGLDSFPYGGWIKLR